MARIQTIQTADIPKMNNISLLIKPNPYYAVTAVYLAGGVKRSVKGGDGLAGKYSELFAEPDYDPGASRFSVFLKVSKRDRLRVG